MALGGGGEAGGEGGGEGGIGGETGGVRDGISVLTPLLPHIQDQLEDCGGASPVSLR